MSVLRTLRRLVGHVLPHLPTSGGLHHAGQLVGIRCRQSEGADDARLTHRAPLVDQHDPAGPVRSVLDLKQSGVGGLWVARDGSIPRFVVVAHRGPHRAGAPAALSVAPDHTAAPSGVDEISRGFLS